MSSSSSSSTLTEQDTQPEALAQRSTNLWSRFFDAVANERADIDQIPNGVTLVLVPTDDSALADHEIELGQSALRRGADVFFHHVQVADLPEVAPVSLDPRPGARQVRYGEAGEVIANEVLGDDGEWHSTDEPPPGPRDDDTAGLASW